MATLRERREAARLSLSDVAEAVGVKKQTVGGWELQGSKPSKEKAEKLEEVLANPDRYRKVKYIIATTTEEMEKLLQKAPELKNYINGFGNDLS